MRRDDRQRHGFALAGSLRVATCAIQRPDNVFRQRPKMVARRGQRGSLGPAFEQWSSGPILQGADTTAERGLSHVAGVRRAREISLLGQRDEVLEPVKIHGDAARAYGDPILALADR